MRDFDDFLRQGYEQLCAPEFTNEEIGRTEDGKPIVRPVLKYGHYLPVPYELLIAEGAMTEEEARARGWTPTLQPRIPRRRRLRWRIDTLRERLAYRLFRLVAGYEMRTDDD